MTTLSKSERPKIQPALQSLDYVLEALAAIAVLAMLGLAAMHYTTLPAQIPSHYGISGQPDALSNKMVIWLLPAVGTVLYLFMTFINRNPQQFNYTVKINPENAAVQYAMATRLVRAMKAFVMLLFAYLVWRTIGIAQNEASGLHFWLMPVVVLISVGAVFFYVYKSAAQK